MISTHVGVLGLSYDGLARNQLQWVKGVRIFTLQRDDTLNNAVLEEEDNTLPVIAGISAGALVFIGLIIVMIVVLLLRRRRAHLRDGSLDHSRPKPGESSEPGYIYPNFGYAPDEGTRASPSPYTTGVTSPYLTPLSDRPVTQYSLP
ncbi:hypothetical protein ElyMa_002826700, partial [Elysia marginata]